ncbi:hypothetical protein T459_19497 [Capsicum annuum]|uniref:PB1-like domain-containing protein n=1 Tax=Capsicum annuum TaxID=4072 RepID=A0A2G2Z285_CAPAN|nr:hypothetical protein T459_19497 [Capsicum annuum]
MSYLSSIFLNNPFTFLSGSGSTRLYNSFTNAKFFIATVGGCGGIRIGAGLSMEAQAVDLSKEVIVEESRAPLVLSNCRGCKLYVIEGREYLDLTSGIAVSALGYSDTNWINVVTQQANVFLGFCFGNLMDSIIITTRFHHGGKFVSDEEYDPHYIGESEVEYVSMDKDHFSIFELLYYIKEFGYMTVGGFYFKDSKKKVFIEVENDLTLVSLVEDLKDGDFLDLYVNHVVDELEVVEYGVPSTFLSGPVGDQSSNVVGKNSNVLRTYQQFMILMLKGYMRNLPKLTT